MSVTFIIGRSGSGKTHRCFRQIINALRAEPMGSRLYWLLPRQATFMAERRLTCQSGLAGFCRARVVSFEQLGDDIFAECGGSAVPEVTPLGRQMILGHLLRKHSADLKFFRTVERQAGLAAELDGTFDEIERFGKSAEDLSTALNDLGAADPTDIEGASLRAKLLDLRLLYNAYLAHLGQERLDQHRRLQQVLTAISGCAAIKGAIFYVDGFLEFTDHERKTLAALAKAGVSMQITLLLDPRSPMVDQWQLNPHDLSLFHRTETTYRLLRTLFASENIEVEPIIRLTEASPRFLSSDLALLEKSFADRFALNLPSAALPDRRRDDEAPARLKNPGNSQKKANSLNDLRIESTSELPQLSQPIPGIERFEAADRVAEVDAIARRIRDLLAHGYRLRDVAILVRNLETYYPLFGVSFAEHEIPYFVDRRRDAAHHPLVQLLRMSMQVARSDWSVDSILSFIKTGLAGLSLDEADELENYVLLHRVRGAGWESPEPWTWRADLLRQTDDEPAHSPPNADQDPAKIDRLRRVVTDALRPFVLLLRPGEPLEIKTIASAIFKMFDALGVRATLAKWIGESTDEGALAIEQREEHEQVWKKLVELFDQLVDVLGEQRVTPTDFSDIIESGLERFDLAITPPTADQVLIGQVDRTRLPPGQAVRAVFVAGLAEGEFPATPHEATVLSDRERRELSRRRFDLDPDTQRQLLNEQLLGYMAVSQASERLIISRTLSDQAGRKCEPSVFWLHVGALFPTLKTVSVPRSHSNDVSHVATPRQLFAGLMRWVRAGRGSLPPGANSLGPAPAMNGVGERSVSTTNHEAGGTDRDWVALYRWLVDHQNITTEISRLRQLAWPALSYQNSATLDSTIAARLFLPATDFSVSQLETMAACPFRHFVRDGLHLQSREQSDISGLDLGAVYHRLLEQLISRSIREKKKGRDDFSAIDPNAIHAAAVSVGKSLRGEVFLSSARNRYLLQHVEHTLSEVIASQRAMMTRSRYTPSYTGVAFGEGDSLGALSVSTPRGRVASVVGRIDRVDMVEGAVSAVAFDYRLGEKRLALQDVYHGLSLQLAVYLLALQSDGESLIGKPVTPTAAFYLQILRSLQEVSHPDEALDPSSDEYLLSHIPRGIFDENAFADLDSACSGGFSEVVSAYKNKDGDFGRRATTDVATPDEFQGLLSHVKKTIGRLADSICEGNVDIAPYRILRQSPCANCEYKGVCRFETSVNFYRYLEPMKRERALEEMKREAGHGK